MRAQLGSFGLESCGFLLILNSSLLLVNWILVSPGSATCGLDHAHNLFTPYLFRAVTVVPHYRMIIRIIMENAYSQVRNTFQSSQMLVFRDKQNGA